MKIVFFGNGPLAANILVSLIDSDEVVGVVVHPEQKAKNRDKLLTFASQAGAKVFGAPDLRTPEGLASIRECGAEIGISIMFGYILRPDLLEVFPRGCINLHPAFLPYNRGAHPNVWPIIEGTPAGVTLHQIDAGIDTGPIYSQREVPVDEDDTAETLYAKLMKEAHALFEEAWPHVKSGRLVAKAQVGEGTSHKVSDLAKLNHIDLDAPTTARKVINQLRARTFPPYEGAWFADRGGRIFMSLELTPEE